MEDKTPIYLLCIVGMVVLVAMVYMLTGNSGIVSKNVNTNTNSAITGNVVATDDAAPVDLSGVGRFIVGVVLIGSCIYIYRKWD
jgi:hypothetical protein